MDVASSGPIKKKRKYEKLSLDQKVQIIRAAEMGYSQRTLASQYNCGKTQIHLLVTQKDMWLAKWERSRKHDNLSLLNNSASSISTINSLVWDFYKKACLSDIIVTGPMLQERAQQISDSLHVSNFVSNPGWLEKFMKEFNVTLPIFPSDINGKRTDESAQFSPTLINGYEESNVFCLGMVELPYRTLPCLSRKIRDFLTVCFVVSANGDKAIESLVFPENSCVEGELWNVNVPCFSSPMGQVTMEVYQHSLNMLNERMSQSQRKILLYVNEKQFPKDIEKDMTNIKIQTWSQDAQYSEITHKFRLLYCQRLLISLASKINSWNDVEDMIHSVPIWKLMRIVQSAWNLIPVDTVKQFFKTYSEYSEVEFSEDIKQTLQEIADLIMVLKNSENNNPEEDPDFVVQIAEEILGTEVEDKDTTELEGRVCSNATFQPETLIPLLECEAVPTLIRLEMFIQTLSDSKKRKNALNLIIQLEREVEDLLVEKKTLKVNS